MRSIHEDGYIVVPDVLDADFVVRARDELAVALAREDEYHRGHDRVDRGMVLVCSMYGGAFLELFTNTALMAPFEAILGPGCIVYAYTSSSMPPGGTNYSARIHRDCPRRIPGYPTNMGATILLDDFTEENGATWYLPRSHTRATDPTEDEFRAGARRLIASKGTVLFFDALLFHAGGVNRTDAWRHALTINMCRPYMKQRLDLPRITGELPDAPEVVLQKLGYRAQVPASLDEYYAPREKRKYRQAAE